MRDVVLYITYSTTHQRSVEVQFGRCQKNILQEWSMVKNLSCVSCAAWNVFAINSLHWHSDACALSFFWASLSGPIQAEPSILRMKEVAIQIFAKYLRYKKGIKGKFCNTIYLKVKSLELRYWIGRCPLVFGMIWMKIFFSFFFDKNWTKPQEGAFYKSVSYLKELDL